METTRRRNPVDYAEFLSAAQAITARGERVTLERVRAELKGGSYSTLLAYMRQYKGNAEGASALAPPDSLIGLVAKLWEQMGGQQEREAEQVRESAAVAQQEAEAAAAEAERNRLQVEAERDRLAAQLEEANQQLWESRKQNATLESKLAAAQATIEGKDSALSQLAARLDESAARVATETAQHKTTQERLARLEALLNQREAERDQARAETQTQTLAHETTKGQLASQVLELSMARQRLADAEATTELTMKDLEAARRLLEREQNLQSQLDAVLVEVRESRSERNSINVELSDRLNSINVELGDRLNSINVELGDRLNSIELRLPPPKSSRSGRIRRSSGASA